VRNSFELTKTPYVDLQIEAICESCGHAYSGATRIVAVRYPCSFLPFIPTQAERVEQKVQTILKGDYGHLTVMRCPKCRYAQSWNVVAVRKNMAHRASGVAGLVALLAIVIRGLPEGLRSATLFWLMAAVPVASLLVYWAARLALKLYDPNRRQMPATRTLAPKIVPREGDL
jgi:hypothetical protein